MKRVLVVLIAVAVVVAFAGVAMAGIADTKHNLSSAAGATSVIKGDIAEICIYCHTPHGGDTSIPLWNRSAGSLPVQVYTSTTMSVAMTSPISGVSRACLSCHDGSTSINSLVNVNGSSFYGNNVVITDAMTNLGTDLRNDHPIGISMADPANIGPDYQQPTGGFAQLFGATLTVECASCHDVHTSAQPLFLRASNTNSQICTDCHRK